jgi:acetylornithine/succinyldiaminopimelate/putrescine aminotransferase
MGEALMKKLEALKKRFAFIKEVRGMGLLVGMELDRECGKIVSACLAEGLLVNCAANNVLRFVPPLTITRRDIQNALAILEKVLAGLEPAR